MKFEWNFGTLRNAVYETIDNFNQEDVIARIWKRDYSLWKNDPLEISNRLGWLDSPQEMLAKIPEITKFAASIRKEGFSKAVLLGMGGSSLAGELFSKSFERPGGFPELIVMDSTHPDAVLSLSRKLDPETTFFIVATKSGGTVETLSLFKYFCNWLMIASKSEEIGHHFAAITDPGSALAAIASKRSFRNIFLNDPNIGGRYSALSFFGLVPASLCGVELEELLDRANAAANLCRPEILIQENPAAMIGAYMTAAAGTGRDKLTFNLSPSFASFGDWVEQLIAESTGKGGKGILPVVGESDLSSAAVSDHRAYINIHTAEAAYGPEIGSNRSKTPSIEILLEDPYDLGGQLFIWEMATAIAGFGLGIHPFNQPDVETAKALARELIHGNSEDGEDSTDDTITNELKKLGDFLGQAKSGRYIAIQAYLPPNRATRQPLQRLREKIGEHTGMVVTLGYGPRYLHSTGQLHKGDGGEGSFIQLVGEPHEDTAIPEEAGQPGSSLSFGELIHAQAQGDAAALRQSGRRVLEIKLSGEYSEGIEEITKEI